MHNDQIDFTKKAYEMDRLITEAKVQFEMDDHTRLPQPVHYRILWLGYTHVTYEKLDFQMVKCFVNFSLVHFNRNNIRFDA